VDGQRTAENIQDNRYLDRSLNPSSLEYDAGMLSIQLQLSGPWFKLHNNIKIHLRKINFGGVNRIDEIKQRNGTERSGL
jgi:hypothetical protein